MIITETSEPTFVVADVIARGGVIAFRTDTFYGLGADPFNAVAIQKIRELKGREEKKPILVLVSDTDQIDRLIEKRSNAFNELAKRFWPGPLTIIGEATAALPDELTADTKTVGVRLPDDDRVRALVRACGGALTATSANPSGESPARTAEEVQAYFSDRLDLVIDDGPAQTDRPSTVVNATTSEAMLIREGVIPWAEIEAALPTR